MQNNKETDKGNFPWLDIIFRTLRYWPWVTASVIICLGLASYYLLKTPNVYTETASVLIKEDFQGGTSVSNEFSEMGLVQTNVNVQNELSSFKSPDLMEEVVRRLGLTMNYYDKGRIRKEVVYGTNNPIKVTIPNSGDKDRISFNLSVGPDGKYEVTDLKLNSNIYGKDYEKSFAAHLGDTVVSPMGLFVIEPSPFYKQGRSYNMVVEKKPLAATVKAYAGRVGTKLENKQGTIINLSFTDQSIQRADDVLNTLIQVYNETWIDDKNQVAVATTKFINERLANVERELGSVDSNISSYKSSTATPDLDAAARTYLDQSSELTQELLDINNQLQMTLYLKDYLKAPANAGKVLPTNTGVQNLSLESQINKYNEKLLERNALVTKSSDQNPLVATMDAELGEMRGAILASVENSVVSLQTKAGGLQGAKGATTSQLSANPTQAKYLLSAERQQKVMESLYLFLLQKREENELSQTFTASNTRVIKAPSGSGAPTAPKSNLILTASFLIGLLVPFGIVYILEIMDTRVRGRKDVEDLTVPLLGEIPQVGKSKIYKDKKEYYKFKEKAGISKDKVPLVQSGMRDSVNEAFRVLRTNIEFTRINKEGCDVVAITSFNPSSGKSFITVNLGVSVALRDHRVLIIDGDMRHASASAYVGKPKEGLADYLAGNVNDVQKLLVQMPENENLWILPVGSIPPNPTELLENPRFGKLIEEMRRHYDYILIDCPPIEVVADAQLIDKYADRTIFAIRAGLLERSMLPILEKLYEDKKYKRMAFILNGTHQGKGRYGYSYSYKYGYGYGYGEKK